MFEKEAEERANRLEEKQTLGVYDNDEDLARDEGFNDGEVYGYEEGFKDGAEFGYNKANEWHYVKDGNPNNDTECIVIKEYEGANGKYTRYKLSLYKGNHFLIWNHEYDSYVQLHNVIAWKEIVPPKESE